MPRRQHETVALCVGVNRIASHHLSQAYWEMSERLEIARECPVCLEAIEGSRSFLLLNCGHYCHATCWIFAQRETCMICRT